MKENLKDFLLNLIISAFIGIFVGMVEVTITNMNTKVVGTLITDSIIGAVIGTVSRFIFIYISDIKQKDVKIAFMSVFIVIGVISSMPSVYCYLVEGGSVSIVKLSAILLSAELLGMSLCYYSYKKCLDLNLKLKYKKKEFN